ncbi:hypothetical protein V5O48_012929 [Marasmius crinis-equi]|uniref:F-box domain-containing protein n=1 Tax=Marasmius crinis-equi TaxID=585013 RepID=A0ABR3F1G8_9AGAR
MDVSDFTSSSLPPETFRDTVSPRDSQVLVDAEKELNEISKEGILANAYNSPEALRSPIHRLPPEILTKIFAINCVGARLAFAGGIGMPDVFSISQVCRRWREILLFTPSFWSDFQMYYPENKGQQAGIARMTRLFLERSKNVPLTLMFLVPWETPWRAEKPDHLSLLVESAERWKNVDMIVEDFFHPFFRLLSERRLGLCSLQSLELKCGIDGPKFLIVPLNVFERCASLVSVRLNDLSSEWRSLRLPWKQLTRLQVCRINSLDLIPLLGECPRLRDLTLEACSLSDTPGGRTTSWATSTMITLPHLETLSMPDCDHIPDLLGHLTLPRLSFLRFQDSQSDLAVREMERIVEFLHRSACTITQLAFQPPGSTSGIGPGVEEIVSFLCLFPSLQTLSLEPVRYRHFEKIPYDEIDAIVTVLVVLASAALPRLEELIIDARKRPVRVLEHLCAVVEEDQRVITSLRGLIIWIESSRRASEQDLESLRRLREVGVRMDIVRYHHRRSGAR